MELTFDITAVDIDKLESLKAVLKQRFAEMITGYIEDANKYVNGILEGVKNRDFEKISRHAHPLKSASASVCADGLSSIARIIEDTSKQEENLAIIENLIEPLQQAFEATSSKLQALLDKVSET